MGLPMQQDIHNPTIANSSSSSNTTKDDVPITELIKQKDELEAEMTALGSVLESHGVTMNTPLLTPDGFPRADLDIAQIRTTRARIIHLQNDHKDLLERIEPKLYEYFAANRPSTPPASTAEAPSPLASTSSAPAPTGAVPSSSSTSQPQASSSSSQPPQQHQQPTETASSPPFARINTITPNSPASAAGLEKEDLIITFGEANWLNNEKLSLVAQIVGRSEGLPIAVTVARMEWDGQEPIPGVQSGRMRRFELEVTPSSGWGGRGSLGCHLVPV